MSGRPFRKPPDDFAEQCARLTQNGLCEHYGCGSPLIRRWAAESGCSPLPGAVQKLVAPPDLRERASEMHGSALARYYGVSENRMRRLLVAEGIEPRCFDQRARKAGQIRGIVRAAAHRSFAGPKSAFVSTLRRDHSLEGMAADYLRKWAPVYRCTERGGVPEDKTCLTHWRYGNAILTPEEMVERARAKGFDPEAWERLAA